MSTTIASLDFDIGHGEIQLVKNNIAEEVRAGQDGMSIFGLGQWGMPFEFQTVSYHDTYVNAIARFVACNALMGIAPVVIGHEGIDYSADPLFHQFIVKDVQQVSAKTIVYFNRAINHGNAALAFPTRLILNWILIPVIVVV